jgi:MarR family 2-MHQ and catechol resistance regulon transcriptional repressor
MPTHYVGTEAEVRALNLYIKLLRASNTLMDRVSPAISEGGLTISQFGVLEALYHLGPLCQKELGVKLLLSGGNITMVVNNLEKQGLVVRLKTGKDRRFVSVHLTWRGTELVKQVFPRHLAQLLEAVAVLSPPEQDVLSRLCRRLGKQERT